MADNNVRQSLDSFRDKMGARIKERLARPTIAQGAQEQNERQAERKSEFSSDFKADKATYIIMGISAIFTAILGLLLGLAPSLQTMPDGTRVINFNTDLIHWAIAIVYAVSFVTVTEAAFLVAKRRFHAREEGNNYQWISMVFMMVLAGISIIGTGWAGGTVGASVLGFLTKFRDIPESAQNWVVGVVPVLLAVYAFCLTVYKLSSEEEKTKRITEQMKRQQQLDHKLNMDMANLEAEEMMQLAEMQAYLRAVENGALSAGEVKAARRAGKTLGQLEKERGEDLDGDGSVANRPIHAPKQETNYTLQDYLSRSGMTKEQAERKWSGLRYSDFAADCNPRFDYISGPNMRAIYGELVPNPTEPVANNNHRR